jgi:hypothetical protein
MLGQRAGLGQIRTVEAKLNIVLIKNYFSIDSFGKLRLEVLIAAALSIAPVYATASTTNAGYVACKTQKWLKDYPYSIEFANNEKSHRYITSGKCLILLQGITVIVTNPPKTPGGPLGFLVGGIKLWSFRKAINY